MTSLLILGFFLGIRHALEADHIATVASLASSDIKLRQILKQGLAWGVGHSLTLLVFGAIILYMDTVIPDQLAIKLEMVVGLFMVILGADVMRRAFKTGFSVHKHQNQDGRMSIHAHTHSVQKPDSSSQEYEHAHPYTNKFPLRALLMGLIHGMAGSAALILFMLDRIDSIWSGLFYVTVFSVGSILGMLLFSLVISIPFSLTAKKSKSFHHGMQISIGALTSGLGVFIVSNGL